MKKLKDISSSQNFRPIAVFLMSCLFLVAFACAQIMDLAGTMWFYGAVSLPNAVSTLTDRGYMSGMVSSQIRFEYRDFFDFIFGARYISIGVLVLSCAAFLLLLILLLSRAGKKPVSGELCLSRMDRFPPDLAVLLWVLLVLFTVRVMGGRAALPFEQNINGQLIGIRPAMRQLPGVLTKHTAAALLLMLATLWLLYTVAARLRANTLTHGTALKWVLRAAAELGARLCKWASAVISAARLDAYTGILSAVFLAVQLTGLLILCRRSLSWFMGFLIPFILVLSDIAFIVYIILGAAQLRSLISVGKKLAGGDLDAKVDTEGMFPHLRRHGEDLCSLGQGLSRAVAQRMSSERMRTELITNVSHDIKTPLTSIINYVDLLQKPHTGDEEAQYLDVLSRQSDKLRRLAADLVDVSMASTGNMPVELAPTDLSELISQAVAEYDERFSLAGLTPVVSEEPVSALADGKHLWRVLDNLLCNAVKYAQPDTRLYIDVERLDGRAVLSLKNISREPLNISGEELLERFVRGDRSRSTEGSGLGLSIAGSLTELMGGSLDVTVDGDLFKVRIILKLA